MLIIFFTASRAKWKYDNYCSEPILSVAQATCHSILLGKLRSEILKSYISSKEMAYNDISILPYFGRLIHLVKPHFVFTAQTLVVPDQFLPEYSTFCKFKSMLNENTFDNVILQKEMLTRNDSLYMLLSLIASIESLNKITVIMYTVFPFEQVVIYLEV